MTRSTIFRSVPTIVTSCTGNALVRQVVDGLLRLEVGGVGGDRLALRRGGVRGARVFPENDMSRSSPSAGWIARPGLTGTARAGAGPGLG